MTGSLLALQRTWIAALQDPAPGQELAALLSNLSGGQRSAEAAFAIYVNNVRATLIQALAKSFPVTKRLLGPSLFSRAVLHCLKHFPPNQGDLGAYGQDFSRSVQALVAIERGLDAQQLAEVAQLEWILDELGRAPREPALALSDLKSLSVERWPKLRFKLAPQAKVIATAASVCTALIESAGSDPHLRFQFHPAGPLEALDQSPVTHWLIVARDQQVEFHPLGAKVRQWLQLVVNGQSLEDGTGAMLEHYPDFQLLPLLLWLIGTQTLILNN